MLFTLTYNCVIRKHKGFACYLFIVTQTAIPDALCKVFAEKKDLNFVIMIL